MFNSIDIYVAGLASFWYALSHPLSPVTLSPINPPHSPRPSLLLLTVVSQALIGGDGDSAALHRRVFVADDAAMVYPSLVARISKTLKKVPGTF